MEYSHRDANFRRGFTLIELMLVVALIGLISSIAIPNFLAYQLRAKTSEAKTNLSGISISETSYYATTGTYLAAAAEPAVIPGSTPVAFNSMAPGFESLGWRPDGMVFFTYGIAVTPDGTGFTADAAADIDANGFIQTWAYVHPSVAGVRAPGAAGCDSAFPPALDIAGCDFQSGKSTY